MQYFVVCIDYGRRGLEAIVDPEMTRRGTIEFVRERLGDEKEIAFVHHIHDGVCEDVTAEIVAEASQMEAAE